MLAECVRQCRFCSASGLDLKTGGRMGKAQKRVSAKSRPQEIDRVLASLEPEPQSDPNGVEFKIELPKHYRTCHLFDGSIATAIYLRPSAVQGRNGKDGLANKVNLPR